MKVYIMTILSSCLSPVFGFALAHHGDAGGTGSWLTNSIPSKSPSSHCLVFLLGCPELGQARSRGGGRGWLDG